VVRTDGRGPARDLDGLPVDAAPEVLLACACQCSVLDMVVLVDGALHAGACTLEQLWRCACGRRRGAPRLRIALRYADPRSESAWETLLRVLHVVCEVPVEPQFILHDVSGRFVARADLRVSGTRALHEYDGEHHLARSQQHRDLVRARRITDEGWIRRGYTSHDVLHNAVGVLRDADLALGRPHRPDRVRRWHRLLAESLFTPSGQRSFRERLERTQTSRSGHERHPRSA
jgi:very-short-patch-repair endonuclease